MKKILFMLALLFAFLGANTANAEGYKIQADLTTKRLSGGTTLELQMANDVTTQSAAAGDMFSAYLINDIPQGSVILPRGTVIRGNVEKVTPAKRLHRAAILKLNFDHIVAPNGAQLPIKAGLSGNYVFDSTGGIVGGVNYGGKVKQNAQKSGSIIKNSVDWGIQSGNEWFKGGKYLVTPFSTIGGVIGGACYLVGESVIDLFKKGDNVLIKRGEIFNILLIEPLDVPVSE